MQQRMTWGESISISKNQWFKKYQELSKEEPNHILLESGRGGKFQMMGLKPVAILRGEQNELHIKTDGQATVQKGNPLHLMRDWMKKFEAEVNPDLPPFQGGAIGFISYDYIRYVETIPDLAEDSLKTPDVYFLIFDDVFVYDQEKEKLWIIVNDEADCKEQAHKRIDQYKKDWMEASAEGLSYERIHRVAEKSEVSMSEAAFSDATTRVHEYIGQGDVFQVNLSVRQSQQLQTHPMHIYEQVRKINPSPYMSYMQTEEFHIVSCSPELLVKKPVTKSVRDQLRERALAVRMIKKTNS